MEVKIIEDSISQAGKRLTTMQITYHRFVHAEFMTHRDFSRNAASSRAIPINKMIEKVQTDPAIPVYWGKNKAGMQAVEELVGQEREEAIEQWLFARDSAVDWAKQLNELGIHKQIVNRVLEPFMQITVIVTATEWTNFFGLRCHPDAQPEIKQLAEMMLAAYNTSTPKQLEIGQWHLPYIWEDEKKMKLSLLKKLSVARCARVSYLTHEGTREHEKDIKLYEQLSTSGHWSPFEHVATPYKNPNRRSGNFVGYRQYRKQFKNEYRTELPTIELG